MAEEVLLSVDQGSNLTIEINVNYANGVALDLSTYTVACEARKNPYTSTSYSFQATGAANGLITLTMNAVTSNSVPAGRYLYDVEITSPSDTKTRVQEGLMVFHPNITKS